MAKEKHSGWVANLSNGETAFESAQVPGERTPWGKLNERCAEEGLWVTQIQLQIEGKTWVGISNADGYCWFRDVSVDGLMSGVQNRREHAGIGSIIGNVVYCTVIDSNLQSKQSTRPLASMRAHCVLKPAGKLASFDEFKDAQLKDVVAGKHPLFENNESN